MCQFRLTQSLRIAKRTSRTQLRTVLCIQWTGLQPSRILDLDRTKWTVAFDCFRLFYLIVSLPLPFPGRSRVINSLLNYFYIFFVFGYVCWIKLSFPVHVKLLYRIVSYSVVRQNGGGDERMLKIWCWTGWRTMAWSKKVWRKEPSTEDSGIIEGLACEAWNSRERKRERNHWHHHVGSSWISGFSATCLIFLSIKECKWLIIRLLYSGAAHSH